MQLNDDDYALGWAFFVNDERSTSKLPIDSVSWALGWLAAFSEYDDGDYDSLDTAVFCYFGVDSLKVNQFISICEQSIEFAKQSADFYRLPSFN